MRRSMEAGNMATGDTGQFLIVPQGLEIRISLGKQVINGGGAVGGTCRR